MILIRSLMRPQSVPAPPTCSKSSNVEPGRVIYFFCKNTDADKNTPISIIRSLVHQLYLATRGQRLHESLSYDLGMALDGSGQQKAVNFSTLWRLFSAHVGNLSPVTVILDALDECQDPEILIQGMKTLSIKHDVNVIVTSRKEAYLVEQLENNLSLRDFP